MEKTNHNEAPTSEKCLAIVDGYKTSKIAGVNLINHMLYLLRDEAVPEQCISRFTGDRFGIRAAPVARSSLEDPRYRPAWIALAAANRGIFGDLVEAAHSGSQPTFTAPEFEQHDVQSDTVYRTQRAAVQYGKIDAEEYVGKPKVFDCLWSYAFKDGKKRSVVIANIDVTRAFPVAISFPGTPDGKATRWLMDGESHLSNNEPEHEPQVFLKEGEIKDFKNGYRLTVPPASITTIVWRVE